MSVIIEIFRFFVRHSLLVYLLLAMTALWLGSKVVKHIRQANRAIFGLEREIARQKTNRLLTFLILMLLLALGEMILTEILTPNLPALAWLSTPTLNPLSSPAPVLSSAVSDHLSLAITATSDSSLTSGCLPDQIAWTFPRPGEVLRGTVTLRGTIRITNFGFYKYEYAPLNGGAWSTVQAGRSSGQDIELGRWDTSLLPAGEYLLRLVVTDNDQQEYPPCVITVRVAAP